jgi:cell division protein ZapA
MTIVTITIDDKNFQLACNKGDEERLKMASERLNALIKRLRENNSKATTELLLIISALSIQDDLISAQSKLQRIEGDTSDEKVADALSQIAEHLENLAQKIR